MRTPRLVPMIIDYEDSETNYRRRVKRLALSRGSDDVSRIHYWPGKGMPLVDHVEGLKRYTDKHGVGFLVVDSAAPACGGDVLEVEKVIELFGALKKIGLPALLTAHITKAGDTIKPYGVVFWHNEARRTWYVHRVQEEDSDEIDVGFYCRKVNDGRLPRPLAFHASFSEDEHGPVAISLTTMERAPRELLDQTSARNRVWAALGGLSRSARDIAEETGLSQRTVEKELKRGPFAPASSSTPSPRGGRPTQLWTRVSDRLASSTRTTTKTPPTEPLTPPKGVSVSEASIGTPTTPLTDFVSEIGVIERQRSIGTPPTGFDPEMRCWKCGSLGTAYDGEMRPVCEQHS